MIKSYIHIKRRRAEDDSVKLRKRRSDSSITPSRSQFRTFVSSRFVIASSHFCPFTFASSHFRFRNLHFRILTLQVKVQRSETIHTIALKQYSVAFNCYKTRCDPNTTSYNTQRIVLNQHNSSYTSQHLHNFAQHAIAILKLFFVHSFSHFDSLIFI